VKKTTPGIDEGLKSGCAQEIPPVLDRYEAKYTIPESLIAGISDFIRPYCYLDKYSERETCSIKSTAYILIRPATLFCGSG
jgi:hypothetical protein